jgi:hypothetical protein
VWVAGQSGGDRGGKAWRGSQGLQGGLDDVIEDDGIDLLLGDEDDLLGRVEGAADGDAQVIDAPGQPGVDGGQEVEQAAQQAASGEDENYPQGGPFKHAGDYN